MSTTDGAPQPWAPLRGVRVLDFTQAIFGALATQILGDAGADVVKVEPPGGDFMRVAMAGHGQDSAAWLGTNRSKRSIAIDLRLAAGRDLALQMAADVDVVVHNYRQRTMERLGLGFHELRAVNSDIVFVELSAYGPRGPMAGWAGGDMWAQAMGGTVANQGLPEEPPYLAGPTFVDHGGAVLGAFVVMLALRERERTGQAQHLNTSLLDSVLLMQAAQLGDYLIDGVSIGKGGRGWRGMFPYGAYTAADGDVVIIHGTDDAEWAVLTAILGISDEVDRPEFSTNERRKQNKRSLYAILDQAFRQQSRQFWQQAFKAAGLRCDPCLTYEELFKHEQIVANKLVLKQVHKERGELKTLGVPYSANGERPRPMVCPPAIGEQAFEILAEFGVQKDRVKTLIAEGVVVATVAFSEEGNWPL